MVDTGGFDIVFQFRPIVVNDIITRQLNDPLALTAQSHKFVQRHLTLETILPSELSWGDPTVDCADHDMLQTSVAISGGIRPAVLNHNVILSASVQMPLKVAVRRDASGAPYVEAEISSVDALALRDVQVGLAGINAPAPLVGADLSQVTEPLRPFLAQNLLQSLARLSHSYALGSIPARFPALGGASDSSALSVISAGVRVLTGKVEEALALGLSISGAPSDATAITSAFSGAESGNSALVVSAGGLNRLIERALVQGKLQGTLPGATAQAAMSWRWIALNCVSFGNGALNVSGHLVADEQEQRIATTVFLALDSQGHFGITSNSPLENIVIGALQEALLQVLSFGTAADGRIWQVFTIPGSSVSVNAPAQSLRIEQGGITILYETPLSKEKISPQFPARKPAVSILQQPALPMLSGHGAPLTVTLRAQVVSESFPPYDFEWRTDNAPAVTQGAERQVIGTPTEMAPGPHTLTTTHLRMIDLIGQVATDDKPVRYTVRPRRRLARIVITGVVIAILAALITGGIGVANGQIRLPFGLIGSAATATFTPTDTPTPTLTPTPLPLISFTSTLSGPAVDTNSGIWAQTCVNSKTTLENTTLTLDNTGSNVPISWQISFTSDPAANLSSDQIWATANDTSVDNPISSGTTAAGALTTLTITPAPQLCTWLPAASVPSPINLTVIVTYNPSSSDTQQPITFSDQVTPPAIIIG